MLLRTRKSGLPASLEEICPPEFRYWETGVVSEAKKRHQDLIQSGFFTPENLFYVDGKVQKVVISLYRPETIVVDGSGTPEDIQKSLTGIFGQVMPIRKANADRQSFLAVVLEPRTRENPDLQKEYYSKDEIWNASKRFMEYVTKGIDGSDRAGLGLMHARGSDGKPKTANDRVRLIGNLIAPTDFEVTGPDGRVEKVADGTWLHEWYVPCAETWDGVKKGVFNGLSIDGNAMKMRRAKAV